jgi:prepilin-type N-terminal cleavage/methylation domain-containing protein
MNNQRGVTFVELLVVLLIMGAVFTPITIMLNLSLKTESEVSIKNDVQHEARFIMEYVIGEMRNSNVIWVPYNDYHSLSINNSKN